MLHATKFVCSGRCYTESQEKYLKLFRSIGGIDDLELSHSRGGIGAG